MSSVGGTTSYSIDTSALIDGLERYYPIGNFPGLWAQIERMMIAGRVRISEMVWAEATKKDEPVKDWLENPSCDKRSLCHTATTSEVAGRVGEILEEFPDWAKPGKRNEADPFVVALAVVHGLTVISGEKTGGPSRKKAKVPDVCDYFGVSHISITDLVREEGWVF